MKIERFEDIQSWKKAQDLTGQVYAVFKNNKDYGFRDQIQRAAISISNNVAEGYERRSNSEFKQFLFIAKGSCGEVRSMLYAARTLQYLDKKEHETLLASCLETSKLLSGLIKTL